MIENLELGCLIKKIHLSFRLIAWPIWTATYRLKYFILQSAQELNVLPGHELI